MQGLTFDPRTGGAVISEHGPGYDDEVTFLTPGGNGGWDPIPEGRDASVTCNDGYCGYGGNNGTMPMTDVDKFPDAMQPSWVYNGPARGMAPAEFLVGGRWGEWQGGLLVAIMRAKELWRIAFDTDAEAVAENTVSSSALPAARYRALRRDTHNNLLVIQEGTEASSIVKVTAKAPVVEPGQDLMKQCGGAGFEGDTSCATGTCTVINEMWSECM